MTKVMIFQPPYLADIYETDQEIVLKMELVEMKKDDVRVILENKVLTLRGQRKFETKVDRENYHRIERNCGEFLRSFALPTFIDESKDPCGVQRRSAHGNSLAKNETASR